MILKGEKTILRPIKMSDAPRFVKWFADPEVNQFIMTRNITLEKEREYIRNLPQKVKKGDYLLAIDTKSGTHIGSVGLAIDKTNQLGSFGIVIGDKKFWSSGYGTDVTKTILDFGFKKLKLHKIVLSGGVFSYNPRAIRTYEKAGFKKEGVNREAVFYDGKFHDDILMGIINREWKSKK